MNELAPFNDQRQLQAGTNGGSIAIEQERAIAEARGQIQLAKMFPRSIAQATEELLEACKNREFAEQAFYSVPNRGSGPSIRFAEEIARCYGNFEYGHRELSRTGGKSEVEVYAWDKEKNNYSKRQITVDHVRYTRSNGNVTLKDPNDIDNRIANVAAKQMRGRILALVSKSLVAVGIEACKATLTGNGEETIGSRVRKMIDAFSRFGVKSSHLAEYIGHSLDDANSDDLTNLIGVYNALREGAKIADYFAPAEKETAAIPTETGKSKLGQTAAAAAKKPAAKPKAKSKPEPKPEVEPEPEPKPVDNAPEVAQDSASEEIEDDIDSMFD